MRIYNKLVRDKIPEIITQNGEIPIIKTLSNDEYLKELNIKLQEEMKEYLEDNNVEELADIVEVIYGILDSQNVSLDEFENIRKNKVEKRGAFSQKIFLKEVMEEQDN